MSRHRGDSAPLRGNRGRRRRRSSGTVTVPLGLSGIALGLAALALSVPSSDETPTAADSPGVQQESETAPGAEGTGEEDGRDDGEDVPILLRSVESEVDSAEGDLEIVEGEGEVHGDGELHRYAVEVEAGLPGDPEDFAAAVEEILGDPRSWEEDGQRSFQRVDSDSADFRVTLAAPDTTDELCAPLATNGFFSCYNSGRAVINQNRWVSGVESFDGDMETYRIYLINHEVGHALGHGHVNCPGEGEPAPVMQQQSMSLQGCEPNGWVDP